MSRGVVVKGGKALPELSKPAGAAQIVEGYQALNQDGDPILGSLYVPTLVKRTFSTPTADASNKILTGSLSGLPTKATNFIILDAGSTVGFDYAGAVICMPSVSVYATLYRRSTGYLRIDAIKNSYFSLNAGTLTYSYMQGSYVGILEDSRSYKLVVW